MFKPIVFLVLPFVFMTSANAHESAIKELPIDEWLVGPAMSVDGKKYELKNLAEAEAYCASKDSRLPTGEEMAEMAVRLGARGFINGEPNYKDGQWGFDGEGFRNTGGGYPVYVDVNLYPYYVWATKDPRGTGYALYDVVYGGFWTSAKSSFLFHYGRRNGSYIFTNSGNFAAKSAARKYVTYCASKALMRLGSE